MKHAICVASAESKSYRVVRGSLILLWSEQTEQRIASEVHPTPAPTPPTIQRPQGDREVKGQQDGSHVHATSPSLSLSPSESTDKSTADDIKRLPANQSLSLSVTTSTLVDKGDARNIPPPALPPLALSATAGPGARDSPVSTVPAPLQAPRTVRWHPFRDSTDTAPIKGPASAAAQHVTISTTLN